jgi:hypothetical protein
MDGAKYRTILEENLMEWWPPPDSCRGLPTPPWSYKVYAGLHLAGLALQQLASVTEVQKFHLVLNNTVVWNPAIVLSRVQRV